MKIKLKRNIYFTLLFISHVLFSYYYFGAWWNSFFGFLLILFFSYLIWNKDFAKNTGLKLDAKSIFKSLALTVVILIGAYLLMKFIANRNDVNIRFTTWKNYFHTVFYILNEEIVIGAILLFYLVNERKIHALTVSFGLAVFFALIHFVFYKWIFLEKGIIGLSTLTTLFFVGFVRNILIIQSKHIGYSWALHFGWMAIMFGCLHFDTNTNAKLSEYDRFNMYLGSTEMVILSFIITVLGIFYWKRNSIYKSHNK